MNSFEAVAIPTDVAETVRSTTKGSRIRIPGSQGNCGRTRSCRRLFCSPMTLSAKRASHLCRVRPTSMPKNANEIPAEDPSLRNIVAGRYGSEEQIAESFFADPEVNYIHVRSTEAGCAQCRLERCR
jgi:Protein of unknown function (DUF1203)